MRVTEPVLQKVRIPICVMCRDAIGLNDIILVGIFAPKHGRLVIVQVPRDTWIHLPHQRRRRKINSLPRDALLRWLSGQFGISRNDWRWISMHIEDAAELIDAIGGIEVDFGTLHLPAYQLAGRNLGPFGPGVQHLDGRQAVCLVRYRGRHSDIWRQDNQRRVLIAILRKLRSLRNPFAITRLRKAVARLESNLSSDELSAMALAGARLKPNNIRFERLPGSFDGSGWRMDKTRLAILLEELSAWLQGKGVSPTVLVITDNASRGQRLKQKLMNSQLFAKVKLKCLPEARGHFAVAPIGQERKIRRLLNEVELKLPVHTSRALSRYQLILVQGGG